MLGGCISATLRSLHNDRSLLPVRRPRRKLERWGRLITLALVTCFALLWVAYTVNATRGIVGWDLQAYWQAALRLREGAELYGAVDPDLNAAYRYAPWFAFAWVPLTSLPYEGVAAMWIAVLFAAWGAMLYPLRRSAPALILLAALTFHAPWVGNIQPLMMLPLVYRLNRADGPVWIGVAASLKAFPIVLALFYLGRREWRRSAIALGVTLLLAAPMVRFDLRHYPIGSSAEIALLGLSPLLWVVVAGGAALTALAAARRPWGPLAAASAVIAAHPRLLLYDASYLLAGIGEADHRSVTPHGPLRKRYTTQPPTASTAA